MSSDHTTDGVCFHPWYLEPPMAHDVRSQPPLRVLHVNAGNLYGGVERILVALAARRHLCGSMEPQFAICFDGRLRRDLAGAGAALHVLGDVRIRSPLSIWRARRALSRALHRDRPDMVVCHSAWCQALFGRVARAEGIPSVQWLHNRTTGRQLVEVLAARSPPDAVLCVSRSTGETVPNLYPRVPWYVWYAPLTRDPSEFEGVDRAVVRRELDTPRDDTVLIQVSRMEAWKGHREHLRALERLRDVPRWTCWFVGGAERPEEESYLKSLREEASRAGIAERVRFLGRRADVPRLLAAADVFCQPNLDTEGFSIAFTEAFLAGLPIVTSAIGGALEIVDDSCGILLPPRDIDALTEALRRLVLDGELAHRLGCAGRARVLERCDPRRQMPALGELLAGIALRAPAEPHPRQAPSRRDTSSSSQGMGRAR